jgi:EmrB/QacA subfamily drug resistance transporter
VQLPLWPQLILIAGSLGDIFGRKLVYIIGLIGFGVTSILCGIAWSVPVLISMRILQGIAAALMVPGALAILNTNIPEGERGVAIGRWAAWSGISTIIGPLVGGYLIDAVSWRGIFFINIPIILACLALALPSITESKDERPRTIDWWGAILTASFLALGTYGLIQGPVQKWSGASVLALILAAVLFVVFIVVESRTKDPLVSLKLFTIRNFLGANITTFAMYGALSGFFFSLVIYLQTTLQYTSIQAGLASIPATILLLVFSGRMGRLVAAFGPRIFMTLGPIIASLGIFLLLFANSHSSYVTHILPGVLLFGIGLTLLVTPLTVTVMKSVAHQDSGIASGINNAVSRVAGLIVIAVLGFFGPEHTYFFSIIICATLAMLAGVASAIFIRNQDA